VRSHNKQNCCERAVGKGVIDDLDVKEVNVKKRLPEKEGFAMVKLSKEKTDSLDDLYLF